MADDDTPKKQTVCLVVDFDKTKVHNNYENIEVVEALVPVPGNGQYLVRMLLRPLNPTDLIAAEGGYGEELHKLPFVNGSEGVGVIEATGPGDGYKFKKGQRVVAGDWIDGTWQEYLAVDENVLLAVPDELDDYAAAQFLINPCTVVGLLETAAVPKGEWLLQTAASSTVGRQLIAYAKHEGVKTINVVRRHEYVEELKALGADEVIDSSEEDFQQRTKEITGGRGAYSALDAVGGLTTRTVIKSVRKFGDTYIYGLLSSDKAVVGTVDMWLYSRTLGPFILYNWLPKGGKAAMRERMQRTMDLLVKGVIKPGKPWKEFPLKDVHEAIAEHKKPGHGGRKVFLEPMMRM